jgi:hypothetical protein
VVEWWSFRKGGEEPHDLEEGLEFCLGAAYLVRPPL